MEINKQVAFLQKLQIDELFLVNKQKELENLYLWFKTSSDSERRDIRGSVDDSGRLKMLSAAATLSEIAFDTKNTTFLSIALTLISIEDFRWDERESVIYLSVIWYVSEKISTGSDSLFREFIASASSRGAGFLSEFLRRSSHLKSLRAMGLNAIVKENKISFEHIPPPWAK